MNNGKAKPGDIIVVKNTNRVPELIRGVKFTVLECPNQWKDSNYDKDGAAWIKPDGWDCCVSQEDYFIVVTSGSSTSCTPSSVDESLDKQRDDNLRSIFG